MLALVLLFLPATASANGWIPEKKTGAASAPIDTDDYAAVLVQDVMSGKTLFEYQSSKQWPAASLTKLMTSRVFTSTPTNWNATGNILSADEVGGGRLQLPSGTTMSLRDVLYSAMIGSANNAATALARMFNGRGLNAFVQDMNAAAERFGLAQTRFYDPSGMNPQNTISAYDVATMLAEAAADPEIGQSMVLPMYHFVTRSPVISKTIKNTNDLLFMEPDLIVTAGKTGFLYESEYNYTVRVYPKGHPEQELIVVVLGASTREDSVNQAVRLVKWAWSAYSWNEVSSSLGVSENYESGDRGPQILALQRFLNANGYTITQTGPGSPGHETSYYGALTRIAVKRFQEANKAAVLDPRGATEGSGYLDALTRAAMNAYEPKTSVASASAPKTAVNLPPMCAGVSGAAVRTLQELLAREAEVYPEALITGYYGPLTKQAVQRFQMKHGIVSSAGDPGYGYVGPQTRAKLAAMYGS